MRKIADYLPSAILAVIIIALIWLDIPGWLSTAWLTFLALWMPLSRWRYRYRLKHPLTDDWQYLEATFRYWTMVLITIAPISLLLGWSVDRLAQSVGTWLNTTWVILCAAFFVASYVYDLRRETPAVADDQEK